MVAVSCNSGRIVLILAAVINIISITSIIGGIKVGISLEGYKIRFCRAGCRSIIIGLDGCNSKIRV